VNYDTFLWLQEKGVERQKFRTYLQPLSHQGGVQTLDGVAEVLRSPHQGLSRLAQAHGRLAVLVDQTIALMRGGREGRQHAAQGVDAARATPDRGADRRRPDAKPVLRRLQEVPRRHPAADRPGLQAGGSSASSATVSCPRYRTLQAFFNNEYLPKTRDSIAAADLPNGKAYYDYLAGYYTTTDLTADQIHALGLKEVARIRAAMEKIKAEVGFKGSLPEFFTFLRTDPRFFEKTPEALLTHYRDISKRNRSGAGEGVQDHSAPALWRQARSRTTSPRTPPLRITRQAPPTAAAPASTT
jgi:uncharacterized protein (DUF885 family)